ncbi:MAG: thiamine-phosphate kinase [Gammaproteobacteria bacterium]|nr:thiamine-phosphate kinase [Gammaproteobacteria bacterium]
MNEFDLIRRYFAERGVRRDDVPLGIGDDAALLTPPPSQLLAVTVDTLHSGVHFDAGIPAADLGYKALAVNLSDLAAMGAEPAWATLALSLPQVDEAWLTAFAEGFFALAERHGVQLVGGDTTRGPLSVTVQVQGFVPQEKALTRRGARPGDHVFVTGSLGDAGAGLAIEQGRLEFTGPPADFLLARLHRPTPRVGAGLGLRGLATAAIDISDGLAQDLGHILTASGVGAVLDIDHLPLSDALLASGIDRAWRLAVSAGDDYELCFTVPADAGLSVSDGLGCPVTRIGRITAEPGQRWQDAAGVPCEPPPRGWDHFAQGEA